MTISQCWREYLNNNQIKYSTNASKKIVINNTKGKNVTMNEVGND